MNFSCPSPYVFYEAKSWSCLCNGLDLLTDDIYCILLPELEKMIKMSPLWHRICRKLFSSIDEPSLDAVIEPLLVKCKR